jgi:GGDEF domain-containing protein
MNGGSGPGGGLSVTDELARSRRVIAALLDRLPHPSVLTLGALVIVNDAARQLGMGAAHDVPVEQWPEVVAHRMVVDTEDLHDGRGTTLGRLTTMLPSDRIEGSTDAVTSLPTRDHFLELLGGRLTSGPTDQLLVVGVEIERFDEIARFHGPEAEDLVVERIARILESALRDADVVARTAPERFAVLAEIGDTDLPALTSRLSRAVCQSVDAGGRPVPVTALVTWARPFAGDRPEELLARASISRAGSAPGPRPFRR